MVDQCSLFERGPGAGHDICDNALAKVIVGHADHGSFGDTRRLEETCFNLSRAHLIAASLDEVGGSSSDDPDSSILSARSEVSGVEPPVFIEDCRGGFRPVEVTRKDAGSAYRYFGDGQVIPGFDGHASVIDEAQLHSRNCGAHIAGSMRAIARDRAANQCLGKTVTLIDALASE
jgi:hypothetical protein